ncbi:MAG: zinc metalloprotease HtpX [Candidatus Omnitrophica bacterium]|nr:zinc metalloprotease HtpX [Candidatus Omnitrophota bacterium]
MNYLKTGMLLVILTMLLVWIGGAVGGAQGASFAFIFALMLNFISYWYSDKIVLAMYGARELSESDAPALFDMVRDLAGRAGLPMPRLFLIPQETPNAFATGRNPQHACVAVTEGIVRLLDDEELRGVLAHELSHVKNRDMLIMSVTATIAGAITMIANFIRWAAIFGGFGGKGRSSDSNAFALLIMSIVAPIAALIVQLAISRTREYGADRSGAQIAGTPKGLASALGKLEQHNTRYPIAASPTTAHLFIVNPLHGNFLSALFRTHPPIEERIRRLLAIR